MCIRHSICSHSAASKNNLHNSVTGSYLYRDGMIFIGSPTFDAVAAIAEIKIILKQRDMESLSNQEFNFKRDISHKMKILTLFIPDVILSYSCHSKPVRLT